MITGKVRANEAWVRLTVAGSDGQREFVDALVDTGFNGWLTLPGRLVQKLGLSLHSRGRGTLADGSTVDFDSYEAAVLWDDDERAIVVDRADATPLLCMEMLSGHELKMQVRNNGNVTIRSLEPKSGSHPDD